MRSAGFVGSFAMALIFVAVAVEAKVKDRIFVGCVEARDGKYTLSTTSVKGKARNYALVGTHDFSQDVGRRVRVSGKFSKRVLTAVSVSTIAANCRL